MKKSGIVKLRKGLLYSALALFMVGGMINCGGSSSNPAQVKAPKGLIQDFVAKHKTMVDTGLVDLYVRDEQASVAAEIQKTIEEKKESGELQVLQHATFDFSNLQIEVVGEKEEYINDRPIRLIKVAVTGSYVMKQENDSKVIPADDTIVLEMVNNNWKVTEKIDPWKEYHYKGRG